MKLVSLLLRENGLYIDTNVNSIMVNKLLNANAYERNKSDLEA